MPQFSAISAKTNEEIPLPANVVWNGIRLDEDQCIVYITEDNEFQYITSSPFDENKMYRIIIFDYSK